MWLHPPVAFAVGEAVTSGRGGRAGVRVPPGCPVFPHLELHFRTYETVQDRHEETLQTQKYNVTGRDIYFRTCW